MPSNGVLHMLVSYLLFLVTPILVLNIFIGAVIFLLFYEKKRKRYVVGYIIFLVIQIVLMYRYFFPTYWKYPDPLFDSDIVTYLDIQELYGPFDKDEMNYKAYYTYADREGKKHYYVIEIDTDGFVSVIYDDILD